MNALGDRLLGFAVGLVIFGSALATATVLGWLAASFVALELFPFPWPLLRAFLALAFIAALSFALSEDAVA